MCTTCEVRVKFLALECLLIYYGNSSVFKFHVHTEVSVCSSVEFVVMKWSLFNVDILHFVTETSRCYYDWVKIFQQQRWSYSLEEIGKYCGSTLPPPRRIKNMVLISFKSDSSYHAQGFHLKYGVDSRYPVSVLHGDFKL
jgi:hypothetical protein